MTDGMTTREMEALSVYALSDMASCETPDGNDSPGGRFLDRVRNAVVNAITEGRVKLDDFNDDGQLSEIADDAPSVYTAQKWAQFVDLGAYNEDPECTDEWPTNLGEAAGIALYQIADRLAYALCQAWRDGWTCPVCGEEVDGPNGCDTDTCGNPAGALVALVAERLAGREAETVAEPLPIRTPGKALAEAVSADRDAVSAVYAGPVDMPPAHMLDPVWDLIHRAEATTGEISAARMGMAHDRAVSRFRRKVWTVAGILAVFAVSAVVIFG